MLKKIALGLLLTVVAVNNASAQEMDETWTPSMRQEFRQGCATELEDIGFITSKSWSVCDCMASRTEEEFGLAEFGYITAIDERDMPEIESRFEAAISSCF